MLASNAMDLASMTQHSSAQDPRVATNSSADDANGTIPDPFTRYGKPLPKEWIPLYEKPMHTPTRKLRVVVVGAGFSAMTLAHKVYHVHKLSTGCADDMIEMCIYESNDRIGGTWLVNTYPGVGSDVPAHIYTFTFEPNPDWNAYYAAGDEILEYFTRTVTKYDLARDVKCGHRVEAANFDMETGKWHLQVKHEDNLAEDQCDIFISATGFLSKWRWPAIPGLHDFRGQLCHSAAWKSDLNVRGQKVGIIGNGSSAIQILPQLVDGAAHLINFVRRPTYITPGLGSVIIDGQAQYFYTEEEKQRFRDSPETLKAYRRKIQAASNKAFETFIKESPAQEKAKRDTQAMMKARLNHDEELAAKLTPDYEVGCRRATPGPGYLESFMRDNVSVERTPIEAIESQGVKTTDGHLHKLDILICATGFDVSHAAPWVGRHGTSLTEAWKDEPRSYLSLAAAGFPNFFIFTGPNAPVGHGSLMAGLEWSADWMCQWFKKMVEEDILWIDPKQEAVDEFDAYSDEIMQTLAWSGGCQSWYKKHRTDGKVTAVWAGSAIAFREMVENIRPEDFELRYRSKNRFRFMGNGRTRMEYDPTADLGFYLDK